VSKSTENVGFYTEKIKTKKKQNQSKQKKNTRQAKTKKQQSLKTMIN